MRQKVGKSRLTVFFQWLAAPEGRKVGSLKGRVRSHLARWEMKKCTPLWREAHMEVKKQKNTSRLEHFWKFSCWKSARRRGVKHNSKSKCETYQVQGTSKLSWDGENVPAIVARSTFPSQNVQIFEPRSTFGSWDVEEVHAIVARSNFEVKRVKNSRSRATFGRSDVKVHAVVARSHFEVKSVKNWRSWSTFGRSDVVSQVISTLSKVG